MLKNMGCLILYLIEVPFDTFANRADPDQAALVRPVCSGSSLFAYGNMIRYDPTPVDLTSNFFVLYTMYKHESLFNELFILGGALQEYS